jgi:hypothetical protein
MSFAAMSQLSRLPVVTARLDSAIADPSTAANAADLLASIFIVTNLYESIQSPSRNVDNALENIGGFSCNLSINLKKKQVSILDMPAFVLSQIIELKDLCQQAELELMLSTDSGQKLLNKHEQLLNDRASLIDLVVELAAWHEATKAPHLKIPSDKLQDIVWAMMESLDMLEDAPEQPEQVTS